MCYSENVFSYVFWMGDLNFRLTSEISYEQILKEVKENRLKDLWKYDQVRAFLMKRNSNKHGLGS